MHSLVELLAEIQQRPALYLGKNYISCLSAFLGGWLLQNNDIKNANILSDFQIWIQEKYHIKSTHSWADIILFYSTDECEALENFFVLFHEFKVFKQI